MIKVVKGDITKRKEIVAAMENAKIDSPRGAWTIFMRCLTSQYNVPKVHQLGPLRLENLRDV